MDSSVSPTVAVGRVAAEIRTTIVLALLRLAFQGAMERVSPPATKTHAERFLKGAHPLGIALGRQRAHERKSGERSAVEDGRMVSSLE